MTVTSMKGGRPPRPVRILQSAPPPDGNAAYVDAILTDAPDDLYFEFFSWRKLFLQRWDIFHVHWPEALLRRRTGRAVLGHALFLGMIAWLKLTNTKIVRTLHNVEPHDGATPAQRRLLAVLEANTSWFIQLNPVTPTPAPDRTTLIPHGDYITPFSKFERSRRQSGRILYFGLIRPYKGVEQLIEAFTACPDTSLSLRIVGRVKGDAEPRVRALASKDPRISTDLRYVDDRTLVSEVTSSDLVVLPYRNMHNSGALIAALSLNRRVLAPISPVNEWVSQEVGAGWVTLYTGELDAPTLESAIKTQPGSGEKPTFRDRSWAHVAACHAEIYRSLAGCS